MFYPLNPTQTETILAFLCRSHCLSVSAASIGEWTENICERGQIFNCIDSKSQKPESFNT